MKIISSNEKITVPQALNALIEMMRCFFLVHYDALKHIGRENFIEFLNFDRCVTHLQLFVNGGDITPKKADEMVDEIMRIWNSVHFPIVTDHIENLNMRLVTKFENAIGIIIQYIGDQCLGCPCIQKYTSSDNCGACHVEKCIKEKKEEKE